MKYQFDAENTIPSDLNIFTADTRLLYKSAVVVEFAFVILYKPLLKSA